MQSPSTRQLFPHAAPAHAYGAHCDDAPPTQLPDPLHACPVCVPPLQLVVPHAVPLAYTAHVPAPLHAPFVPQLAAP